MTPKDGQPSDASRDAAGGDGSAAGGGPWRGRRMRVAVWHNLPSGGGRRVLHDHVTALAGRGHAVEVRCPPTADRRYWPLPAANPEHVVEFRPAAAPR